MQSARVWLARHRTRVLQGTLVAGGATLILVASALLLGGNWEHSSDNASALVPTEAVPAAETAPAPLPTSTPVPTATPVSWADAAQNWAIAVQLLTPAPVSWADAAQNWAVIAQMLALTPQALPSTGAPSAPEQVSLQPSSGSQPPASAPVAVPTATPVPPPPPPPPPPAPSCQSASMSGFAAQLFNDINDQRSQNGEAPLAENGCVTFVAQERSADMAARNYFSHTSPEGVGAFDLLDQNNVAYGWAGENLARNNYPDDQTVDVAIRDLMASQGHRDNILSTNYTQMGVAAVNDGSGMWYYTMVFIGPPV